MAGEVVRVGRVPGRGREEREWRLVVTGTLVMVAAVCVHHLPDPATRPWAIGMGVVLGLEFALLLSLGSEVDPVRGRLRHRTLGFWTWEVVWAEATTVCFQHNVKGLVLLKVRSRGRVRAVRVPIVGDDPRGLRSQSVPVLRLIAAELRRWAPVAHHGVADELDAQADHLEAGGDIRGSPVMRDHAGRAPLRRV